MIHRTPFRYLLALAPFVSAGCEEYYDVDAACHENLSGGNSLDPTERDAMLRINCYRRLTGLTRATANPLLQGIADGEVNYVQQNPNRAEADSDTGPLWWLTQEIERPGFTGVFFTARLDASGYIIVDVGGTSYWEFIHILRVRPEDEASLPSGAAAIDELMRIPLFRQAALQPSVSDMAYGEGFLPEGWWLPDVTTLPATTGEDTTNEQLVGRVYYLSTLYQAPHFEHVDQPVLLPKPDQVEVPLYSWSTNRDEQLTEDSQTYSDIQISYPITFGTGSIDPDNYEPIDQNQYSVYITDAAIVGPNGPLEVETVQPGDDEEGPWPSGRFLRTNLSIYARQPFEPDTEYQVLADLEGPDGLFRVDYSFRTTSEDNGTWAPPYYLPPTGQTPASLARRAGPVRASVPGVIHRPLSSSPLP